MVLAFQKLADEFGVILVGPDAESVMWGGSDDDAHVAACLAEVRRMPGVSIDPNRILVGGFSNGAMHAPVVAFQSLTYSALAVMHGQFLDSTWTRGVPYPYGWTNFPHVWLSSGTLDNTGWESSLAGLREYCFIPSLTYKLYPVAHQLPEKEKRDMLQWFLTGAGSQPRPPSNFRTAGGIPQLPASTSSARALQARLAPGHYLSAHLAFIPKTGKLATCWNTTSGMTCKTPAMMNGLSIAVSGDFNKACTVLGRTQTLDVLVSTDAVQYGTCRYNCPAVLRRPCVHDIVAIAPTMWGAGYFPCNYEFASRRDLLLHKDGSLSCVASAAPGWVSQVELETDVNEATICKRKPRGALFSGIALNRYHAVAIRKSDGAVVGWGCDGKGSFQEGVRAWGMMENPTSTKPTRADQLLPAAVAKPSKKNGVVAMDAPMYNAYALLRNGTLIGWGPGYPKGGKQVVSGIISFKASVDAYDAAQLLVIKTDGSLWVYRSRVGYCPPYWPPSIDKIAWDAGKRLAKAGTMV
ncbi:phospholipase [Chlorella sorokiniana]|uniref:Phospholipase n=1 Tax=Chlorella sorokiniana TaxID=3076 RepID=A0A2P6TF59_CHLSO|nr:phospholipase [Chlorella sorokiniana]|eukprot:PRW32609.1 phospholipase [Chlorella sorokiniana]